MGNGHQLELQLHYSKQRKLITTVHGIFLLLLTLDLGGLPSNLLSSPPSTASPLHPPSLMSTSSLSYLGRDDSNSREEALSLGSNNAGAEQSLVLANDDAELPLQLRTAS